MSRVRSPNFPVMGLREAIGKIGIIFEREHQMPAARDALAAHLGYSGLNGTSLKVISALGKYDLLEEVGEQQFRVSDLAMDILHGTEEERAKAIKEAAAGPALFTRLNDHFGGRPSEVNLKGYLLRNGFAQSAVTGVIDAYYETLDLVAEVDAQYKVVPAAPEAPAADVVPKAERPMTAQAIMGGGEPFSVQFVPGGVRINADIKDQQTLTELVNALQALSGFLKKSKEPDAPAAESPPKDEQH